MQVAKERSQEETSSEEDQEYQEWREKENEKQAQKEYEEQLKATASQRREKQRQIAAEMRDSESQEEPQGIPVKKKRGPKPKTTRKYSVSQEDQRLLELFKNDKVRFLYIYKKQDLSCLFFQCPHCKKRMGKGSGKPATAGVLRKHLRSRHSDKLQEDMPDGQEPFRCDECEYVSWPLF